MLAKEIPSRTTRTRSLIFSSSLPKIVIKWDEATCGQLVYLYTEVVTNFSGYAEEFFDAGAPGKGGS